MSGSERYNRIANLTLLFLTLIVLNLSLIGGAIEVLHKAHAEDMCLIVTDPVGEFRILFLLFCTFIDEYIFRRFHS